MRSIYNLRNPNNSKPQPQLQDVYGFKNEDFLKHIQIRSQLTKYLGEKLTIPKLTDSPS